MKKQLLEKTAALLLLVSLFACSKQKFGQVNLESTESAEAIIPVDEPLSSEEDLVDNSFKLSLSQASFTQDVFDSNVTTLTYSMVQSNGSFTNGLTKDDFIITENGSAINNFSFVANSQNIEQTVDIVFVLDISGSMRSTIESAKSKIKNFIYKTRAQKLHTRFCLVTFGDHTVNKCDKFANNDPNDPTSLKQVEEFVARITNMNAPTGSIDYGGTDIDEGQLRALIDASKSPWNVGSQRFSILVTDAPFHYAPDNRGDSGADAPTYDETLAAIASSQMSVFAAAPKWSGYSKKFQKTKPSLVEAGNGIYFNYDDLLADKISMDTILTQLLQKVKTTYKITYSSEENTQLNPTLSLDKRTIQIATRSSVSGAVQVQSIQSNMPNGRPEYKNRWKISDRAIRQQSMKVLVNGSVSQNYKLEAGEIVFTQTPAAGSKIEISYEYSALADNVTISPILVSKKFDSDLFEVYFNKIKASAKDVAIEKTNDGKYTIRPSASALQDSDPYQIRLNGALDVKVKRISKN